MEKIRISYCRYSSGALRLKDGWIMDGIILSNLKKIIIMRSKWVAFMNSSMKCSSFKYNIYL